VCVREKESVCKCVCVSALCELTRRALGFKHPQMRVNVIHNLVEWCVLVFGRVLQCAHQSMPRTISVCNVSCACVCVRV
jgi:hypothetical protein